MKLTNNIINKEDICIISYTIAKPCMRATNTTTHQSTAIANLTIPTTKTHKWATTAMSMAKSTTPVFTAECIHRTWLIAYTNLKNASSAQCRSTMGLKIWDMGVCPTIVIEGMLKFNKLIELFCSVYSLTAYDIYHCKGS
jgi:hypothetical protein